MQRRLLIHAAECLKPGGLLVYATCSSEPEENEEVVARLLRERGLVARLERQRHPWRGSRLERLVDASGDLRTLPFAHDLEAFYVAVLVKVGGEMGSGGLFTKNVNRLGLHPDLRFS